jgi:hypothetical protein
MSKLLAEHWPHLIFVGLGVIVFLWYAYRPEREGEAGAVAELARARTTQAPVASIAPVAPVASSVKRSVARRGLLALGPLLGAVATGGILYGIDLGGGRLPGAVIWVHAGISTLALLLVAYKVADLGWERIRRAFIRDRLSDLVSVALAAVSVPLAVTGVPLLFAAKTGSFFTYAHLISSAWWTGLLVWHLRRYVGASLRAVMGTSAAAPEGGASATSSSEDGPDLTLKGRDVSSEDVARPVRIPV